MGHVARQRQPQYGLVANYIDYLKADELQEFGQAARIGVVIMTIGVT